MKQSNYDKLVSEMQKKTDPSYYQGFINIVISNADNLSFNKDLKLSDVEEIVNNFFQWHDELLGDLDNAIIDGIVAYCKENNIGVVKDYEQELDNDDVDY